MTLGCVGGREAAQIIEHFQERTPVQIAEDEKTDVLSQGSERGPVA